MVDVDEITIEAAEQLQKIAQQAARLGAGLQAAAPADKKDSAASASQYLQAAANLLTNTAKACFELSASHTEEISELIKLVRDAITQDDVLREQHGMDERFRFVSDYLNSLLATIEQDEDQNEVEALQAQRQAAENDVEVYVYLFNSHGADMTSWRKMLSADVFYEYSVSRPIYAEREQVEKFIASRPKLAQHAYLVVAVHENMVLASNEAAHDSLGNRIIRVKEGAIRHSHVKEFAHDEKLYLVKENGEIELKR